MCGLVAALFNNSSELTSWQTAIHHVMDHMYKRGPDANGLWMEKKIILGHRRLSILDLDVRSNQPMHTKDGRYHIVFNGEIYNYKILRSALEAKGFVFHTQSDTEVLLTLFAVEGEQMLPRLRGMFAFAIWDTIKEELFIARDVYGIKPLYYLRTPQGVLVASQVKAIVASGLVKSGIEPAGLAGFYLWGSVPEPWTLYPDLWAVPAGHWIKIRGTHIQEPVCWYDLRQAWCTPPHPWREEDVYSAVRDSVRAHLVSDVPVGLFLSGGIDSGVIAGLMAEFQVPTEAISIGFDVFQGKREDELPRAAQIAAHYGLAHHQYTVGREEFVMDLSQIRQDMDQPSIDGVNTWFASKAAAARGYRVVLSGVGGDELFCGYSTFKQLPQLAQWGRMINKVPGALRGLKTVGALIDDKIGHTKWAQLPDALGSIDQLYRLSRGLFSPGDLPQLMGMESARLGLERLNHHPASHVSSDLPEDLQALSFLESTHYLRHQLLRDSDWASMSHSLELRTPLVDGHLLLALAPYTANFANGRGKRCLARTLKNRLPEAVARAPKTGFSVPMQLWYEGIHDPQVAKESWARQWAKIVIKDFIACE